jgi:aspartate-semialdehyde dehydrogenase
LALLPLARQVPLERVTVVTLEPASGLGRAGSEELSVQTIALLNAKSGEVPDASVFPQPLAFDCLPLVGDLQDDGESSEELRLRALLRRLLALPGLRVESTRVRVPTFTASLACVHARFSGELSPAQALRLWQESGGALEVLEPGELPTPRRAVASGAALVGRVRGAGTSLAFAVALDDLRRGAALAAVRAAEDWYGLTH